MHVVPRAKDDTIHFSWQSHDDIREAFDTIQSEILKEVENVN